MAGGLGSSGITPISKSYGLNNILRRTTTQYKMVSTYLHIDMDAFFASVEERDNPSLKGHPVAIGGSPDGRKGVITAANYIARKFGIKAGMTAIEAKRLCPYVIFLPGNVYKYTYASARIMETLEQFSPDVHPLSVDEACLNITKVLHLHISAESMGRKIKSTIYERFKLPSTIGIASNPLVAKVAADTAKPDGLRVIPPGQEAAFLAPLPVDKMTGIGRSTTAALNRLGIYTLGELGKADDRMLKSHFGILGPVLAQMARGEWAGRMKQDADRFLSHKDSSPDNTTLKDKTPLPFGKYINSHETSNASLNFIPVVNSIHKTNPSTLKKPPTSKPEEKSIGNERTFGQDVYDENELRGWIVALAEMVGRRVRRAGVKGRVLTLKLRYSNFETLHHQLCLPSATSDEEMFILYGWRLLREVWQDGRGVRLLGISVSELLTTTSPEQTELFEGPRQRRKESLYQAIDYLRDRFGEHSIVRAMGKRWQRHIPRISFGHPR